MVVYDFKGPGDGWGTGGDGPGGFAWSEIDPDWKSWPQDVPRYLAGLNHPRAIQGFLRDMDALMASEACVMVMPCGPSASMEMGWSAGSMRLTCVYMPEIREPDLMVKMADYVGNDLDDICALLRQPRERHTLQGLIADWYKRNGGHANALTAARRTRGELTELLIALERGHTHAAVGEEIADTAICLALTAEEAGCDFLEQMRRKMGINESREWDVAEDGTLTHRKGSDYREAL
jgi:NTP pyrophosphatase (non-canonical NTP hydrolase)